MNHTEEIGPRLVAELEGTFKKAITIRIYEYNNLYQVDRYLKTETGYLPSVVCHLYKKSGYDALTEAFEMARLAAEVF